MRKTILFLMASAFLAGCCLTGCKSDYEFDLDQHIGICGTGWLDAAG